MPLLWKFDDRLMIWRMQEGIRMCIKAAEKLTSFLTSFLVSMHHILS